MKMIVNNESDLMDHEALDIAKLTCKGQLPKFTCKGDMSVAMCGRHNRQYQVLTKKNKVSVTFTVRNAGR